MTARDFSLVFGVLFLIPFLAVGLLVLVLALFTLLGHGAVEVTTDHLIASDGIGLLCWR